MEMVIRRKCLGVTRDLRRELEKRKHALVVSGAVLDTEGLDEAAQELFRYRDDGTVEVRRWIPDVQRNPFRGAVKVCRNGELGREEKLEKESD